MQNCSSKMRSSEVNWMFLASSRDRWEGKTKRCFQDQRRHGPSDGFIDSSCGGNAYGTPLQPKTTVAERDCGWQC